MFTDSVDYWNIGIKGTGPGVILPTKLATGDRASIFMVDEAGELVFVPAGDRDAVGNSGILIPSPNRFVKPPPRASLRTLFICLVRFYFASASSCKTFSRIASSSSKSSILSNKFYS